VIDVLTFIPLIYDRRAKRSSNPQEGTLQHPAGVSFESAGALGEDLKEQLVDDVPALGEDALDRTPRRVAENDSMCAGAQPATRLEGTLQRLDVAPLSSEIAERS
jgi:hypothetical protein